MDLLILGAFACERWGLEAGPNLRLPTGERRVLGPKYLPPAIARQKHPIAEWRLDREKAARFLCQSVAPYSLAHQAHLFPVQLGLPEELADLPVR